MKKNQRLNMDKLVKSQKKMIANRIAEMDSSSSKSMLPADKKKEN